MITIISGTNRQDSMTRKVAMEYCRQLQHKGVDCSFLSLDEHEVHLKNEAFRQMEKEFLIPAKKIIIIVPEYNGSYAGIVKLMIDNSDIARCWYHKKVLLTGISSGRAGNLRGMEHLTGVLMYMKVHVHPNRLPISSVDKLISPDGLIHDEATLSVINQQLNEFLNM